MSDYRYQLVFITKYHAPTNHRGSRVSARHVTTGRKVMLSWDHSLGAPGNHLAAAKACFAATRAEPVPDSWIVCGVQGGGYVITQWSKS